MPNKIYFGLFNIARPVKAIYVSVNGVARRVTKVYFGLSNLAKLTYVSSSDSLPTDYTEKIE